MPHSQSGTYIMLVRIEDMEKIEAHEIQHSYYAGQDDYNFVLAEVDLDEKASPPQMRCADLKTKAMVLQKVERSWIVELGQNKLLVGDLVVDQFEVVAKVQKPDRVSICDPIPLPFYDQERFPFLMSRGDRDDFFIVNTKEGTMQTLIKARHN